MRSCEIRTKCVSQLGEGIMIRGQGILRGAKRECASDSDYPLPPKHYPLNDGGRSSVGRAPDCDSGRRGFESHRSPHFFEWVSV
jgi:hypothetical protein